MNPACIPAWRPAGVPAGRGAALVAVLAAVLSACAHAPPSEARVHVVQKGETPTAIARRYAVPVDELLALNGVADPTKLQVGVRLVLPERPHPGLAPVAAPTPAAPVVPSPPETAPAAPAGERPTAEPEDTEAAADRAIARLLGGGGGADRDRVGAAPPGTAAGATAPTGAPPAARSGAGATPGASGGGGVTPTAPPAKPAAGVIPPIPGPPPPPDLAAMRATFTRSPRAGKSKLVWPVEGVVVSLFGAREGQRHDGIDIGAPQGTAVWAAAAGQVVFAGEQPGYGLLVLLAHDGDLVTVYAHNAANLVRKGDRVEQGDPIAQVGQTGGTASPAVHFEVRVNKQPQNPLGLLPDD